MPLPLTLMFDLLTLKVVPESRVAWATSVPILVFLGLSVLDLGPMYATDVRQTSDAHRRLIPLPVGAGHNKSPSRLSPPEQLTVQHESKNAGVLTCPLSQSSRAYAHRTPKGGHILPQKSAKVKTTVTSCSRGLPPCRRISVRPPGRLRSLKSTSEPCELTERDQMERCPVRRVPWNA